MGKGRMFLSHLAEEAEMGSDCLSPRAIVEIAGGERVLIENHCGVMGYSTDRILVKVKYGCISVCGCGLQLLRMTREQLIISGRIDGVSLHRREKH